MKDRIEIEDWLTTDELARVRQAVEEAERHTSGELRVHLDVAIMENVMDHAAFVFSNLGMDKTRERNGMLLYVSVPGRKVAVVGDSAIHAKLGNAYWQGVLDTVLTYFKQDRFCDGLCEGVRLLGEKLQEHFPHRRNDRDELSNEVSFGS